MYRPSLTAWTSAKCKGDEDDLIGTFVKSEMCLTNELTFAATSVTPALDIHGLDFVPLHWRHNGHDGVSNHQPHDCLLNRVFGRRSKKTSKHRVTGLCAGNSPGTGEFPAQMASNAENVSIWWRHHAIIKWSLPGQNNHNFAVDIFGCIFMNETFCILIKISLKFVPNGLPNNNPALL